MNTQTLSQSSETSPEVSIPTHTIHFQQLIATLEQTLANTQSPSASAPDFSKYAATQCLLQQCNLIQHFNVLLQSNILDHRAATNLRHALALFEKSRAQLERQDSSKQAREQAREQRGEREKREKADQPLRDEACHFLITELTSGAYPADDLFKRARELGISPATLKRAKASLNIVSTLHRSSDKSRFWAWSLPHRALTTDDEFLSSTRPEPDATTSTTPATAPE